MGIQGIFPLGGVAEGVNAPSAAESDRIADLQAQVAHHSRLYYELSAPEIQDADFDALVRELRVFELRFPHLGPLLEVGDDRVRGFRKVRHRERMLSLDNTYSLEDIEEFTERVERELGRPTEYALEPKFDGVAISLQYEEGRLALAATRGNGEEGDDVTDNARLIASIPGQLDPGLGYPAHFEVRGEVYMPRATFSRLNAQLEARGEQPFANARNAASGSLKLRVQRVSTPKRKAPLDPQSARQLVEQQRAKREETRAQHEQTFRERGLACSLYYYLPIEEGETPLTHSEAVARIKGWGLPVAGPCRVCHNAKEIYAVIQEWDSLRDGLPYDTDGVVIKVNNPADQQALGRTARAPRWAIAYKYGAQKGFTRLMDVQYQVGRTGTVTPVAILEKVPVAGVEIQRATLHNAMYIKSLDLHIGDTVCVERAGEVIPKVAYVEVSKRPSDAKPVQFPTVCPACGAALVQVPGEARWCCPNRAGCKPQQLAAITYFVSKDALNIEGIGPQIVERLYDRAGVRSALDLYSLNTGNVEEMASLGFQEAGRTALIEALEQSKRTPADRLLYAFGIEEVGSVTARQLLEHFGSIPRVAQASEEELQEVSGVGLTIARKIVQFFSREDNRDLLQRWSDVGFNLEYARPSISSGAKLSGMRIVVTGSVEGYTRRDIEALVREHGGTMQSGVGRKTSRVVLGAKFTQRKLDQALSLGIPTQEAADFLKELNQ